MSEVETIRVPVAEYHRLKRLEEQTRTMRLWQKAFFNGTSRLVKTHAKGEAMRMEREVDRTLAMNVLQSELKL